MGENVLAVQDVKSIAAAAAVMTAKVAQPKYLSSGGFTRLPITLGLLVRRMTSRISGGARHSNSNPYPGKSFICNIYAPPRKCCKQKT